MLPFTDPWQEFDRMFRRTSDRGGIVPLDAWMKDDVYHLRFDLPGVNPSEVDLTVEGRVLTVTASRDVEQSEDATWLVRERPTGTYSRQVQLGERLDPEGVQANYEHGVLTVTIPIKEEAKPRQVSINAGEGRQAISA